MVHSLTGARVRSGLRSGVGFDMSIRPGSAFRRPLRIGDDWFARDFSSWRCRWWVRERTQRRIAWTCRWRAATTVIAMRAALSIQRLASTGGRYRSLSCAGTWEHRFAHRHSLGPITTRWVIPLSWMSLILNLRPGTRAPLLWYGRSRT